MCNFRIYKKVCGFIVSFILLFPVLGVSSHTSFLPMEDAMSAARNAPELVNESIKPYRESFNLSSNDSKKKGYFSFTTTDICAFIFLAGIYVMLVKKNSRSRNASF